MATLDAAAVLTTDVLPVTPPPAPAAALPWRPGEPVRPLVEHDGPQRCTLGQFAAWLRRAEVLDSQAIGLPGAAVTLPYGMRLVGMFDGVVRRHYEAFGYEEYDYPLLAPTSALEPTQAVLPLTNSVLYAGSDEDWVAGRRRAVLTPTGEANVYTHWARTVREAGQLPIRMYRRARYFRPAAAGRSLFRGIESVDVYEFQACHASRASSAAGLADAVQMVRQVAADMHVPVLWSTRPPWTNNESVADVTIGGDVPLPHGATLQVGCLYDQGDRFSQHYGVRLRDGPTRWHTLHVTGCVTRRLLLAHLFLGMDTDGELLVHPELAPIQVAITQGAVTPPGSGVDTRSTADALVRALTDRGIRVQLEITTNKRAVGQLHRQWRRQGIPLRVYLQPARTSDDRVRAVVIRADTRQEAAVLLDTPDTLADRVPAALDEVGSGYTNRAHAFVTRQCQPATAATVRDILATRSVAVCPLAPAEDVVRAIGDWQLGEVLGLLRSDHAGHCIVSGRPTEIFGYVSPRT